MDKRPKPNLKTIMKQIKKKNTMLLTTHQALQNKGLVHLQTFNKSSQKQNREKERQREREIPSVNWETRRDLVYM